jgi:hypothetical protein
VIDRTPSHIRLCTAAKLRRYAARALISALISGIATAASAQNAPPPSQEEIARAQQEYQDQMRRSRLVGEDDKLAIELPNGDLISVRREGGCLPPVTRNGLIKVDCTPFDGPAYYFDASTRAMVEPCSFWFADSARCPPKRWPVDVPGCDATVPQSVTGTWRFYAVPTAGGFSPVNGGWTMTLTDRSITFDLNDSVRIERRYGVVRQENRRYSLELRDDRSAKAVVDLELASCGLFVESEGVCDAFCRNFADEVGAPTEEQIQEMAKRISDSQNGDSAEPIVAAIRESIAQGPQAVFPKRSFFVSEVVP